MLAVEELLGNNAGQAAEHVRAGIHDDGLQNSKQRVSATAHNV